MTNTSNKPEAIYPTQWHIIDEMNYVFCRQTTEDTYQLRDSRHMITLNKEGFNIWRTDLQEFIKWRIENHVHPVPLGLEDE